MLSPYSRPMEEKAFLCPLCLQNAYPPSHMSITFEASVNTNPVFASISLCCLSATHSRLKLTWTSESIPFEPVIIQGTCVYQHLLSSPPQRHHRVPQHPHKRKTDNTDRIRRKHPTRSHFMENKRKNLLPIPQSSYFLSLS